MSDWFRVRAGYYHNYTGIGRNKEENLTTNEVVDLLNSQRGKICALNGLLSESLPVWVLEKVVKGRIKNVENDDVKKELESLLVELI